MNISRDEAIKELEKAAKQAANFNMPEMMIGVNQSIETLENMKGSETEMDMNQLTELIKQWAKDRKLDTADPTKQMNKVTEEVGELAAGVNRNNMPKIIDSIGDNFVTLVIIAKQYDLEISDCVQAAYDEIKDRKGEMRNGVFVKEADL